MPLVVEFPPDRQALMIPFASLLVIALLRTYGSGKMQGFGDARFLAQLVEQIARLFQPVPGVRVRSPFAQQFSDSRQTLRAGMLVVELPGERQRLLVKA